MVAFSDRFYEISGKVSTFAGLAFCLKIIPLEAVSVSDVTIQFKDRAVVVGLLATLAIYLVLCVTMEAAKDISRQINLDRTGLDGTPVTTLNPGAQASGSTVPHQVYLMASRISLVLEAGFPVVFGTFVGVFCFQDILSFLSQTVSVVSSVFSISW